MATTNFPPDREAELVTFSANFGAKITLTPTAYGLLAAQATAYNLLQVAFVNSYNIAQADATRSPMNVALKNQAKANLIANIRLLGGIVQRFPATTNAMRLDLGLPVRVVPAPIPAPSAAPLIDVKSVAGRTASLRLIDAATPTRRGMPPGVIAASVFSFVGATAPADLSSWKFEGNTGRTRIDVAFPTTVASGATVWFTAYWFNPRKQGGPVSDPVSANLPGGSVSMAA
jgi:hypothetical protein